LGSLITHYAKLTRKIKSNIPKAKAAFNKKRTPFTSKLALNLEKNVVKCYIWIVASFGAETWIHWKAVPGKF
jgi:hypothetical protein